MDSAHAFLDGLLDELYLREVRRGAQAALEDLEDQSSAASDAAREAYERGMVEQARAIVAGKIEEPPTLEHMRVLLDRLDSAAPAPAQLDGEAPF